MKHYTSQCLFYALNKIHTEGGYIKYGKSTHWCIPHVLHESVDKVTTHFRPDSNLKAPWYALVGFHGQVYIEDTDIRKPISLPGLFFGTLALLFLGSIWAALTIFNKLFSRGPYGKISKT